jgi:hypothetical protein
MAKPEPAEKPIEDMTPAELQEKILRVELQTKLLSLAEADRQNKGFLENEKRRHQANEQRMVELEAGRKNREAIVQQCRHKSGGTPKNILKGGGIGSFSIISRAILPDGKSILLQCPRCRMLKYPPDQKLKKTDPKLYARQLEEYNALLEQSMEMENAELRGPTFLFERDGVPIIPDRV